MLTLSILIAYVIPALFTLYCAMHLRSRALLLMAFIPVMNLRLTIEWLWVLVQTYLEHKKGA